MTAVERILEKVQQLSSEQQREVLDFVDFFLSRKHAPKAQLRDLEGLWAGHGPDITDNDIAGIRKEMWAGFPREDV
jgi:hypothetical protein